MSFLMKLAQEGQQAKAGLKKTNTIVTDASGRRYDTATGTFHANDENSTTGYVVDTNPDPGFYECIPGLFIGSQDAAHNYHGISVTKSKTKRQQQQQDNKHDENDFFPGMSQLGITHVINLFSQDRPMEKEYGIKYLNCLLLDLPEQSLSPEILQEPLEYIHNILGGGNDNNSDEVNHDAKQHQEKPLVPQNKVLVHCNAGVSRSSTIIIAYLMRYKGMSYDDSLTLVRKVRPSAKPNAGFEQQLRALENSNWNLS